MNTFNPSVGLALIALTAVFVGLPHSQASRSVDVEMKLDMRKLLGDPKRHMRLQAALALAERQDEEAIGVLIELLADLTHEERRLAEGALQDLAGEWAPNTARLGDDEISRRIRRDAWAAWWRHTDGSALLAAFRKQVLSAEESDRAKKLIAKLGDSVYTTRERANADLLALGKRVVPLLRQATPTADLEHKRRIENCLKLIVERQDKDNLPLAAARLLALRKPAGAIEALLAYLGFTDDEEMHAEIGAALMSLAQGKGTPDPHLTKALKDPLPVRRAIAAKVLAGDRDVALRKAKVISARASSSYNYGANEGPGQAFDNLRKAGSWWCTGNHPSGWIEADLGSSRQLGAILLIAAQNPPCQTTHEIWLSNEPIGDDRNTAKLVHTFQGQTKDGDVLTFTFPKRVSGRYVQVRTTESLSWVGWHKIEMRVR